MEGRRQRRLGSNTKKPHREEKEKTTLTLTGLLMEGLKLVAMDLPVMADYFGTVGSPARNFHIALL